MHLHDFTLKVYHTLKVYYMSHRTYKIIMFQTFQMFCIRQTDFPSRKLPNDRVVLLSIVLQQTSYIRWVGSSNGIEVKVHVLHKRSWV